MAAAFLVRDSPGPKASERRCEHAIDGEEDEKEEAKSDTSPRGIIWSRSDHRFLVGICGENSDLVNV